MNSSPQAHQAGRGQSRSQRHKNTSPSGIETRDPRLHSAEDHNAEGQPDVVAARIAQRTFVDSELAIILGLDAVNIARWLKSLRAWNSTWQPQ